MRRFSWLAALALLSCSKKPEPGSVQIITHPPGAAVYEGATKLGDSPVTISKDGDHVLVVRLDGYLDETVTVKVEPGKTPSVRVELKERKGTVRVLNLATGDRIELVDPAGKAITQSVAAKDGPVDLPAARIGKYELVVKRAGHAEVRRPIDLVEGTVEISGLVFREKTGSISAKSALIVPALSVALVVSFSRNDIANVTPGRHAVRLVHTDRSDWDGEVNVRAEERVEINEKLPALGVLEIETHPKGAAVTGGATGKTPLKSSVKAGRVAIRIEHPEAGAADLENTIQPGQTTRIDVDLWERKAKSLEDSGRLKEAMEAFAKTRNPDKAKIDALGKALFLETARARMRAALEKGDRVAAAVAAREVLRLAPDDAEARDAVSKGRDPRELYTEAVALAVKHVDRKEWKQAIAAYTEALAAVPGDEEAAGAIVRARVHLFESVRTLEGHKHFVFGSAFSPDGSMLATGSADSSVILWDVAGGKERRLEAHTNSVFGVAFSADGKFLATASGDKTIRLWDVASGKPLKSFEGHTKQVRSVAFSPDGERLVSGSYDGSVRLWSIAEAKELKSLAGHESDVNGVVFSPDGKWIASAGDDKSVRLWDASSGEEKKKLLGHAKGVMSVAFSSDGTMLASSGSDNIAIVWVVASEVKRTCSGHTSAVSGVAFSPDGRTLATSSSDFSVRLWEVSTGKELRKLAGTEGALNSVAFSRDGKSLAWGGDNKKAQLWRLNE